MKEHIDHLTIPEIQYYKMTDFISFTEDFDTAKSWASGREPEKLLVCEERYKETKYVFSMSMQRSRLTQLAKGVWEFRYQCNRFKKSAPSGDQLLTQMLQMATCNYCGNTYPLHSLILIRPADVLEEFKDEKVFKRASTLAVKNNE